MNAISGWQTIGSWRQKLTVCVDSIDLNSHSLCPSPFPSLQMLRLPTFRLQVQQQLSSVKVLLSKLRMMLQSQFQSNNLLLQLQLKLQSSLHSSHFPKLLQVTSQTMPTMVLLPRFQSPLSLTPMSLTQIQVSLSVHCRSGIQMGVRWIDGKVGFGN